MFSGDCLGKRYRMGSFILGSVPLYQLVTTINVIISIAGPCRLLRQTRERSLPWGLDRLGIYM